MLSVAAQPYYVDIHLLVHASIGYDVPLWSLGERAKPQPVGLMFTILQCKKRMN